MHPDRSATHTFGPRFGQLTQFKRLRRLSLDHNRLNDGAVRAIEQAHGRSAALKDPNPNPNLNPNPDPDPNPEPSQVG